jgi:hypothetical protein
VAIGFVLSTGPAALAQPTVFAIDVRNGTPSSLYTWPVTATSAAQATVVTTMAGFDGFAMDFNPTATTLFGITNAAATPNPNTFGTIDLATGNFTPIVAVTGVVANGFKIDPISGIHYVNNGTNLFTLDPVTGVATNVGAFGGGATLMIDIAINSAGQMFGNDIGTDSLYSIDKTTGAATLIGPTGFATNFAQGMDFDYSTDTLYATLYTGGGTGQFASFNLATGAATGIFSTQPLGAAGAEMEMSVNSPIPEPTSMALVGVGVVGFAVRRWRQKK